MPTITTCGTIDCGVCRKKPATKQLGEFDWTHLIQTCLMCEECYSKKVGILVR